MLVDTKHLTYEKYLAMPEMKCRYEIIDGELIMAASPIPIHQWIVGNVYRVLHAFVSLHRLGIVLMAPLDILIRRDPLAHGRQIYYFLVWREVASQKGLSSGGCSYCNKSPIWSSRSSYPPILVMTSTKNSRTTGRLAYVNAGSSALRH